MEMIRQLPKDEGVSCKTTHKEGDEDCSVHQNQADDGSPAVADAIGDGTSQEDTNESTTLTRLEKRALPFGGNSKATVGSHDTVLSLEGGKSDKVTVEKHVERLHDLVGVSSCRSDIVETLDMWNKGTDKA